MGEDGSIIRRWVRGRASMSRPIRRRRLGRMRFRLRLTSSPMISSTTMKSDWLGERDGRAQVTRGSTRRLPSRMPHLAKDATNPHYKSKFTPLERWLRP